MKTIHIFAYKKENNQNLKLFKVMKKTISLLFVVGFLLFHFVSCKQESNTTTLQISDDPEMSLIKNYLSHEGVREEDIYECGDNLILEGDLFVSKSNMLQIINSKNSQNEDASSEVDERQFVYLSNAIVDIDKAQDIKYFIDPSMTNVDGINFVTLITIALERWSQPQTAIRVNFTRVFTNEEADLTFFRDNAGGGLTPSPPVCFFPAIPSGLRAIAMLPQNGSCGRYIAYSSVPGLFKYDNGNTNGNQIVATTLHEVGHILGYWHNNSSAGLTIVNCPGDPTSTQSFQMSGTPLNDNSSVMTTPASASILVLSSFDRLTGRFLYPPSYYTPIISSVGPRPNVATDYQVTINPVSPFYYRALCEVRTSAGAFVTSRETPGVFSDGNGNMTYYFRKPTSGSYTVRVRGRNYKGDFTSEWSNPFSFTIP